MTRPTVRVALRVVVATLLSVSGALVALPLTAAQAVSPNIVISQVYGGGGNAGSVYTNDFIELFNRGAIAQSVTGWSVQYASSAGTTWAVTTLTGVISAGGHYLVQEAVGAGGTTPLPTPDATGIIAMSATSGKVALVNTGTMITAGVSCPVGGASIVDFVGYGAANCGDGGVVPPASAAPLLTNTTADLRGGSPAGCADTDANGTDFASGAPNPRNSALATTPCTGDTPPSVSSTTPADNATGVPVDQTISVTFSEGVNATSQSFTISGSGTGNHTFVLNGGPTTWTLDPDTDFANTEVVTVTVNAAFVTDTDATDPPDNMAADYVFDFTIVASDVAPTVSSTIPTNGAGQVPVNQTISVTFSEPVNVSSSSFTINATGTGGHTFVLNGGPTTWTLDPDTDFANGENVTVTVVAANVTDADASDPPDNMAANYVFSFGTPLRIHDIQASAHLSPYATQTVYEVPGIVTAKRSNGFYMQDPVPDANDNTSEGIFVFTSSAPPQSVGDAVSASGVLSEFRAGGVSSVSLTNTEITGPTVVVNSSGNPLPAPIVVGTGGRIPPNMVIEDDASGDVEVGSTFDPAQDGIDFWETLEFMRVQLNNAHVVGPTSDFGSNREVPVVGDNGANANIITARGGILLRQNDNNPERIILNDVITGGPTLATTVDVGDSYPGATLGVIDYAFNNFKLEVTSIPSLVSGGLAQEVTTAPTAGQLAIGSFNVENLDPGDGAAKFSDLANEVVNNMLSPDIIAIEEVQDNNGATNDSTVDASTTINMLIAAIDTADPAPGPTYQFRQINPVDDQDGGEPGGNIRVAFLYRTDRGVAFVDRPGGGSTVADSVVNNAGTPELAQSPGRIAPTNTAWNSSRKPLAGEFTYNGETIFVIANHFNSKGGDNALWGRFQPPVLTSETQRNNQADLVHDFTQDILSVDANANVVVLGDMNDFTWSNPLATLTAGGVLQDLVLTLPEAERYSYVFEGNTQELDHLLGSPSMGSNLDLYDAIHANAEFAPQVSDHDPLVALFSFAAPLTCTQTGGPGPDMLTGTPAADHICGKGGDDIINGLGGDDIIEGGGGADQINGGDGDDVIKGGAGIDTIDGGNNDDTIDTGPDNDAANGGAGNDELLGKKGIDDLEDTNGTDELKGGYGNDTLDTADGAGGDKIDGGKGASDVCSADGGDTVVKCP